MRRPIDTGSPAERHHFRALSGAPPSSRSGDGVVNGVDLGISLNSWGPCPPSGDCLADGADLGILLGGWGSWRGANPCPPS